jgi:hypothetical protein
MIACHEIDLEQRAIERGYTLAEVEACIVSREGDRIVVDETHPAYPRHRPGLGDMLASGLAAVGITKDRAEAVANAVGVKDCGCAGRQAALNRAGYRLGIGTPPPAESGPTG